MDLPAKRARVVRRKQMFFPEWESFMMKPPSHHPAQVHRTGGEQNPTDLHWILDSRPVRRKEIQPPAKIGLRGGPGPLGRPPLKIEGGRHRAGGGSSGYGLSLQKRPSAVGSKPARPSTPGAGSGPLPRNRLATKLTPSERSTIPSSLASTASWQSGAGPPRKRWLKTVTASARSRPPSEFASPR